MRIFSSATAPNPRRVKIYLAEKGIEITNVDLDLKEGDNLTDEFRGKNLFAKVPVLELDDGTCISESMAICRYFEMLHPEPSLFGKTPLEVATIEMWQRQVDLYLIVYVGFAFRHLTGYFSDRETVVKEWGEESLKRALATFKLLENRLAGSRFLAGDNFSIADITAFCAVDFAKLVKYKVDESQPNLLRWYKEVSSRPSTQTQEI
ncbi:MAG: glutathione S-transferase [Deltaproteobacteria bacterium]|jgi:glutathione S-transferase|nr:glutathione S-transferase [Deltaproteobacteria bacterium]MBT4643595.1 glutathione S-transferase [Deltaproteobacteria bacterium]MBT6504321.1 glutathione S-transferase [Deltaproteobacteria bacterium]MBT7154156.1 glutathione S-transferase [Deltaproteobacteria bacterium]MBT7710812.1 glutathione S-transferase [Deltaproteobacteria bacterium]